MLFIPRIVACLLLPALTLLALSALIALARIRRAKKKQRWGSWFIGWISLSIFMLGFVELSILTIISVYRANF